MLIGYTCIFLTLTRNGKTTQWTKFFSVSGRRKKLVSYCNKELCYIFRLAQYITWLHTRACKHNLSAKTLSVQNICKKYSWLRKSLNITLINMIKTQAFPVSCLVLSNRSDNILCTWKVYSLQSAFPFSLHFTSSLHSACYTRSITMWHWNIGQNPELSPEECLQLLSDLMVTYCSS